MVDTVKILGALLGGGGVSQGSGSNVLKNILGAAVQGNGQNSQGGGLGSLLSNALGGSQQQQQGGIGDLLGSVLGNQGQASQSSGGGLGGLIGGLLGGAKNSQSGAQGGGLGDLLGGVLGGQMQSSQGGGADLGGLVSSALQQFGQAQSNESGGSALNQFGSETEKKAVEEQATVIIRAMINAAKADGRLDDREQDKILGQLGNVTQDEIDFVKSEMSKPLDVQGFIRSIPQGMGSQVYAMSLTAIDLDTNEEAQYLHELASGLGLDQQQVNAIHQQLGVRALYS